MRYMNSSDPFFAEVFVVTTYDLGCDTHIFRDVADMLLQFGTVL